MPREITSTKGFFSSDPLPEGRHVFIVAAAPVKKYSKKDGAEFFVWKFQHKNGIGEQVLMTNMMGGLLKALKCDEVEPGKFDWDTDEQEGKRVWATVTFQPDKKDASITRQNMRDFKSADDKEIPF